MRNIVIVMVTLQLLSGTGETRLIWRRLIRSSTLFEDSVKCFPVISCLKCMVNSYFHLFRRKSLPTNDFELTVPELKRFWSVGMQGRTCELHVRVNVRDAWLLRYLFVDILRRNEIRRSFDFKDFFFKSSHDLLSYTTILLVRAEIWYKTSQVLLSNPMFVPSLNALMRNITTQSAKSLVVDPSPI